MADLISVSNFQMDMLIMEFDNIFWQFIVIDDNHDYDNVGVASKGLTPRMTCFIDEQVAELIDRFLQNRHPTIAKKIVKSIMASVNAAIIALFSIRQKETFHKEEIKDYLVALIKSLLDVREGSSALLTNYVRIDPLSTETL